MITVNPLEVDGMIFMAVRVELPKTNLLTISNDIGYIMCAALDVDIFNEVPKLMERNVIAGRAMGVRTIDELLKAPLQKITDASKAYGWEVGMTGKEALLRIS
ncbi:YunC family protein [Oceanobacillus profundus]|uniref:YunC family protein n=1 Tax=Oceanobacillus profundus TaxID=372463 RepID=UPI00363F9EA8